MSNMICTIGVLKTINSLKATFAIATAQMHHSKFVIAGAGAGGISMAAKILKMGEKDVTLIDPAETHYYQPYWTIVGGKKGKVEDSARPMSSVIPKNAKWIKDKVVSFSPEENMLKTEKNGDIHYDYLIVALGLQLAFNKIKGLPDAFNAPGVCSNYSVETVTKTAKALENFKSGNAIFTQPINPIKCAGAPQKIAYLAEEYFTKTGKRDKANMIFNTALGFIFAAPKYAAILRDVAKNKNITVNYFHSLKEVKPVAKEAVFDILDKNGSVVDSKVFEYEMIHITPPMISPPSISESKLADAAGWLDVDKNTLQSTKFSNIFGIGDCTNCPTSKTAAAVAGQCGILSKNLNLVLQGKSPSSKYNGYTSCPIVTGYNKGIIAEFDYDLKPVETFPIDQGKQRYISYIMKKDFMPHLYWNLMLKGHWSGPSIFRKLFRFGFA